MSQSSQYIYFALSNFYHKGLILNQMLHPRINTLWTLLYKCLECTQCKVCFDRLLKYDYLGINLCLIKDVWMLSD